MERYRSFRQHCLERYGCRLYKLALDGGMTCPNRDGTLGTRGCLFCSAGGSGEFAAPAALGVAAQIEQAKKLVARKSREGAYMAYFQSYTNTYAPVERLRALFTEALAQPGVAALSVATRPDCLPDETVALLAQLNREKPVTVELGLQTADEATAKRIRRGYELPCFDDAVRRLAAAGLEVVAHVIIGLPGEGERELSHTIGHLNALPVGGVKLQLLHVLEGSDLADLWQRGEVETLTPERYAELLCGCIERLRPDIVIHRLTGDGPKRLLLAPLWSADKKRVLQFLRDEMERRDTRQGRLF
ncbi:TIGR01212 family radical SAM protein [Feifania hominis]|uniref:TIGR01212 family radical SAM protein n=1 Tax=Feifania hominis TaxID=2763660 RepID=A0A926DD12_9FIRM|nr:TIGR01212 family radical SAM protein [Feifania hominis]MBC8536348.1 TIGR01212 family radical SAM protein [Feifania hominis]